MRRLACLVCVTLGLAVPAAAGPLDFNLFAAVDAGGTLGAPSLDTENGFSAGVELTLDLPVIDIGGGVEYGFPRDLENSGGDFSYTFIYAITRLNVLGPAYLVGRYGYNDPKVGDLPDLDLSGGTAWGAGVGVSIVGKLMVEVMYTSLGGDADYDATLLRAVLSF